MEHDDESEKPIIFDRQKNFAGEFYNNYLRKMVSSSQSLSAEFYRCIPAIKRPTHMKGSINESCCSCLVMPSIFFADAPAVIARCVAALPRR